MEVDGGLSRNGLNLHVKIFVFFLTLSAFLRSNEVSLFDQFFGQSVWVLEFVLLSEKGFLLLGTQVINRCFGKGALTEVFGPLGVSDNRLVTDSG